MFVYNRCTTDARVLKEAASLTEAGHSVRIVAVLDQTTPVEERRDGIHIVRIDRNPIHYRILKLMRGVFGFVRRSATITADSTRPATSKPGFTSLLLLPFLPLRWLAGFAWRLMAALLRGLEVGVRKTLLAPHKPLMFLDYYGRAYRLVRASPPDALHAHDLNTLPVAALLAVRLRIPLTYDAHELYPEISTLSRKEATVWRQLERRLAPRADTIVTVCESIAVEIERRYEVKRPQVLLNCPTAYAVGPGAPGRLAEQLGLADEEPIFLYQGGFAPNRGLQTVIRAAKLLERGTVVLTGWGQIEDELRELVRREGLDERVAIVEPVPTDQVVAYAVGATVGLIPYEPVGLNNTLTTPNKLFDYMAAGIPIAASRLPELVRFVEGEGLGVTFNPGDPPAMAAALNGLLADPARREEMRLRSREAGGRYTWEREAEKLLAIYPTS